VENLEEKIILNYLNDRCGKKYRLLENNFKMIRARLKEGFTKQDFFDVIDNRRDYWLHDPRMSEYLRPATLFCPKNFEAYLNAPPYESQDRQARELKTWRDE